MDTETFRTTDEVLGCLHRRGLDVTRNMLGQDVKAGYLPKLVMDPRGVGGIGRWWTPVAVERAVYLYRLRRRGVHGDLLRVLLFLRDGWGWEEVRPICVAGLQKAIRVQGRKVTGHLRNPTPTNLDVLADQFAEGEFNVPATAKFIWGMGFFGEALPGGSMQPLFGKVREVYSLPDAPEVDQTAERLIRSLGLSWEGLVALVEAADAETADAARREVLTMVQGFRQWQQRYMTNKGIRGQSTNPVTLFGCPPEDLQALLRSLPGRITAAQLLALVMVPGIAMARIKQDIEPMMNRETKTDT